MRQYECYIKPSAGEIIDTTILMPQDPSALITGIVRDGAEHPLPGTLVLLIDKERETLLQSTLTDDSGRFYLGPVDSDTLYILRVQTSIRHTRILELSI